MEVHAAKAESVKQPRLRDQMRDVLTLKRYKRSTIRQYLDWGYRFAAFHRRDPREMREAEIKAFLTSRVRLIEKQ